MKTHINQRGKGSMKKNFLFFMMLAFSLVARAQMMTLDSILNKVTLQNPMIRNYVQRSAAMTAYAQGAGNWTAPEVGGGFWMVPYRATDDPRDKGQIMLSVQQKFTNPSKLRANQGLLASKAGVELANASVVSNDLRAQAKLMYVQWMVLEKKKKVLIENEAIINLILKISRLRYPYGQSKLGSIYKAEARLSEVSNMKLMNDNQILQKNINLNRLMNLSTDVRFTIDTAARINRIIVVADTAALAENRSDVRRVDKSIETMKLNQQLENSQAKPDFTVSFNQMFARGAGMPNQFMLLGMVSIPIAPWSSKMYKANVRGIGKEIEALKSERTSLLNELRGMAANDASEITTLSRQLENYETRIVPALKKNYETVMIAYEENKEELPTVIDAWETLNTTQMQYLDTLQKYYETIVSYEKILERE